MSKLTRRFKKNKRNRTFKKGGSSSETKKAEKVGEFPKDREGIIDIVENKISDAASSVASTIGNAGLRIVGLERVNKAEEEEKEKITENIDNNIEKLGDAASGVISDVGNIVDKTGAAIIENVNEVLGSDIVKETTEQAAENTADIVKEGAETFNEALNDPEVKAEVEEAIENAGEVGEVVVKAAEKPFNAAVDVAAESVSKASGAALSGIIKVGTDAMAAVPYIGSIIEVGKMLNDGTKAASAVVEAGSEAVEAGSDMFIATKENIEKGLEVLEEKKKMAEEISNRTDKSIKDFENPINSQSAGGRRTRRRLSKRKAKSKRVSFSI